MLYVELAVVATLILINGLLAMAELAIASSRRARLRTLVEQDVVGSRRALALASNPGRFLSTVQLGITLVGILSGAFSGVTLGLRLAEWGVSLGLPVGVAETLGVGFVLAVIAYFSLIIGELVPKQIALRNPEAIAVKVAPAMTVIAAMASPIVWLLDASGRAVLRNFGLKSEPGEHVTDEEIRTLIAEAERAGVIEPEERAMIAGVMRLGDRPVRAVMTPRREIEMINLSEGWEGARRQMVESVHCRFPVYEKSFEEVLGVVQVKDVLDAYLLGGRPNLPAHIRSAPVVIDTIDALDVLDIIRQSSVHMALVHDEHGHFEEIITSADILEAIVGAFWTDKGPAAPDAVRREDSSWLISGSMPVDEMAERLFIPIPQHRSYHSAAGFVLNQIGHLPTVGESVVTNGWKFEVVDLDGRRIDKILASRIAGGPPRRAI